MKETIKNQSRGTVVAGALGECVHVAGVMNFLRLAEEAGFRTVFLGPAVPVNKFVEAVRKENATLVGVSYRLTPENGERLLGEFFEAADDLHSQGVQFAFGGTPPVAERAERMGFFSAVFDGTETHEELLVFLKGGKITQVSESDFPQKAIERIHWKAPYPILRHHFGLPTMDATISGIQRIAESHALDVISLGVDQDAQANFFHPERQQPRSRGAGGVPVRSPDDYRRLYQASRRGNFPLLRTYSGTDDFIRLAEMYVETINLAWCAIPLFWFNRMDGRGPWDLKGSIEQHQKVLEWYGNRQIPVELNEPHHWGMRDAPDVIFVVSAFLSAYNARAFGVKDYIAQLMFNSPPGLSDAMDLAKMQACLRMVDRLAAEDFRIWRQVRTGLLSYPIDIDRARGHLAASIYVQMAIEPHIVHIVGHTEADHAATADDVIEASKIAGRSIDNARRGAPQMLSDPEIQDRADELVQEAERTLEAIKNVAHPDVEDAWTDAKTLTEAVATGIMDAPHLRNNQYALGRISTRIDERGACRSYDPDRKVFITEEERLGELDL